MAFVDDLSEEEDNDEDEDLDLDANPTTDEDAYGSEDGPTNEAHASVARGQISRSVRLHPLCAGVARSN